MSWSVAVGCDFLCSVGVVVLSLVSLHTVVLYYFTYLWVFWWGFFTFYLFLASRQELQTAIGPWPHICQLVKFCLSQPRDCCRAVGGFPPGRHCRVALGH